MWANVDVSIAYQFNQAVLPGVLKQGGLEEREQRSLGVMKSA